MKMQHGRIVCQLYTKLMHLSLKTSLSMFSTSLMKREQR